jgi:uncharacterized protein RhaS with RHS repeats
MRSIGNRRLARRRRHHHLWLRCFRHPRLPDRRHHLDHYLSVQILLRSLDNKGINQLRDSTEYVFNGDSLLATVDQGFKNGSATGTAQTRYIHPDHLGSTNIVIDASGTVVQTLDCYPYGATRISQSTGGADSARKYIGQFADASGLNYLQARYQDPQRGQFI